MDRLLPAGQRDRTGPLNPEKQPMDPTTTPALASIGIDIGKEVFHIVGFGADGKIAFRRKIKRLALIETFKQLPACIIGMEACLSAHFVSRALRPARTRAPDHSGTIHKAVREGSEERLQ
jgi:hypothetical protein